MADSNQPTPNIGANGFVWLLVAAAGTYFVANQVPLEGSRPQATERHITEQVSPQDIDARLWQDPFATVAERLEKLPEINPEHCLKEETKVKIIDHCRSPLALQSGSLPRVLVASVSAAPYAEDHEFRRRTRYAILAGLNEEGFVPDDAQHIGFYWPEAASKQLSPDQKTTPSRVASAEPSGSPDASPPVPASQDASSQGKPTLPKFVPFEWLRRKAESLSKPQSDTEDVKPEQERTLLLWFDEDVLGSIPLKTFHEFLCNSLVKTADRAKTADRPAWSHAAVLGPESSATLQAMVEELLPKPRGSSTAEDPKAAWTSDCPSPQFYVYSATIDDAVLIPGYMKKNPPCVTLNNCLSAFFRDSSDHITLHRVITTNEDLAKAIRGELRLRNIDRPGRPSQIALVSEWDTLYGRTLPEAMARCLGEEKECNQSSEKPWLYRYKYLRGLDGQISKAEGLGAASGSRETGKGKPDAGNSQDRATPDNTKAPSNARSRERAEGQGQSDYLRRLGDRMQRLDAELRQSGTKGIEAVGILGYDTYDKLLILQALRPLLPDALFFTTDLDALVLHPGELTNTRNVLIASGFGLQLRPAIQGEIPPFRSSYQTAGFLASRLAISDQTPVNASDGRLLPQGWLRSPLLFEVGRSHLFQFASQGPGHGNQFEAEGERSDHETCKVKGTLLGCNEIHPRLPTMFPRVGIYSAAAWAVAFSAFGLCIAAGCAPLRRHTWDRVEVFLGAAKSYAALYWRGAVVVVGIVVAIAAIAGVIKVAWPVLADWLTQDGQPMTWLEGTSVWPTVLLRVATLILCVLLLIHGYWCLNKNMEKITHDLLLTETPPSKKQTRRRREATQPQETVTQPLEETAHAGTGKEPPWIRFASQFWYRMPAGDGAVFRSGERLANDIHRFWQGYIYQGYLPARTSRVIVGLLALMMLWTILYLVVGLPTPPVRGNVSWWAYYSVTLVLGLTALALIVFVADTTLLCWRLIGALRNDDLRDDRSVWPKKSLQEFHNRLGVPKADIDDWIDLLFISKRTKCICPLIYAPFLIIALLLISGSRLFANYGVSIPDLVTTGVGVLIVTGCAVALRWSAEASRAKAHRRINGRLMVARKSKDDGLADQLETLLRRVEELRDGAFSPFSQQPVVRAMILPLGSLGGTALLEYLLLPGLS